MAPSTLRRQTLTQLRKAVRAMMSPAWDAALEDTSAAEVTKAARTLLSLQRARLRLANAELAEIRDRLRDNEEALVAGSSSLDRALRNLGNVRRVLDAATAVLTTVRRIIDVVV